MTVRKSGIVGAGLLVSAASTAAGAQQPARSMQQDFDAATVLSSGTDHATALAAWEALEKRTKPGSRTNAVVLVRKGETLWWLRRDDDAVAAVKAGLATLPVADATLRGDRATAYITIGRVTRGALDYAGAATAFAAAEPLADDVSQKLGILLALIEVQTFTDPAAATASLARATTLLAAGKPDAATQAAFARRRAVLALNTGDLVLARAEGERSVRLLGGLTSRTDLADVSARGDAALALILADKPDIARQYLAYTGAGRLPDTDFDPAAAMTVPDCGGEAGLRPADLAVVEFSIGDDGSVTASSPVYAAGGGSVGLEFARAARRWSWTPEQVRQLPPFYRHNVRVEMRCSTAFQRPSVGNLLRTDLVDWLEGKGVAMPDVPANDAAALPRQRAALAAAEAAHGPAAPALIPLLVALGDNAVVGREEGHAFAKQALTIAQADAAPPGALLGLAVAERISATTGGWRGDDRVRRLRPLLTQAPFAADPKARSALRLLLADEQKGAAGTAWLREVAADPALKPGDPMRVGALVRLASREQAAGDAVAARATFDRSGLSASQCALLDTPPHMLAAGGSFPTEAMRWGFEGWTQTEFDVDAAGKVVNERAILSYPAFVFTKAGTATMHGARFSKSFRPDGGLGCGGLTRRVRFKMG